MNPSKDNRLTEAEYEKRYGAAHRKRFEKWPWNKMQSAWAIEQAKPPKLGTTRKSGDGNQS